MGNKWNNAQWLVNQLSQKEEEGSNWKIGLN